MVTIIVPMATIAQLAEREWRISEVVRRCFRAAKVAVSCRDLLRRNRNGIMTQPRSSGTRHPQAVIFSGGRMELSTTPVAVSGLTTAIAVSAGYYHTCAVLSDGSIWCWGYGGEGELGTGTYATSPVPVLVREPEPLTPSQPTTPTRPTTATTAPTTPTTPSASSSKHKSKPTPLSASLAFQLPSVKQCVSGRHFTIHVRRYRGITWIGAVIKINGKRVRSIGRSHITALVNLVGLPKGRFVLSITATASDGRKVTGTRTYHTCVPKSKRHYAQGKL